MDNEIEKIVTQLIDGMGTISRSETVVGPAQKAGDASVIPVHRVRVGFGVGTSKAGAAGGKSGGSWAGHGAGGAVEIDPIAAIAVGKDGRAKLLTVEDDGIESFWSDLVREVPGVLRKIASIAGDKALTAIKKSDALDRVLSSGEDDAGEEAEEAAAVVEASATAELPADTDS